VAYADISRPDIASNVKTDDKDKKPKNALRKASKPRVGEDE
jgi:hypothetical protein